MVESVSRSDNRTTVPLRAKKRAIASYKKKVCIRSRLFPLGSPGQKCPEGPKKFLRLRQTVFSRKVPENFYKTLRFCAGATRSVAMLQGL